MSLVGELAVVANQLHRFAAPPQLVFMALVDGIQRRSWLELATGEVEPSVVMVVHDRMIVWSSLWQVSPDDLIHFDLTSDGAGTAAQVRWFSNLRPDDRELPIRRDQLNQYLGASLRSWIDSGSPGSQGPTPMEQTLL